MMPTWETIKHDIDCAPLDFTHCKIPENVRANLSLLMPTRTSHFVAALEKSLETSQLTREGLYIHIRAFYQGFFAAS